MATPHFLLVGNGPYTNRGCEAITRGTVVLLEHFWGKDFRITQAVIGDAEVIAKQAAREVDKRITTIHLDIYAKRFSPTWCSYQLSRLLKFNFPRLLLKPKGIDDVIANADVILQIGGDNYSLHFNKHPPYTVVDIDKYIMARSQLPIVIWGASIGPFDAIPNVAREMFYHLHKIDAIMARETVTYDYLRSNGITGNLHLVADPAFLMAPVQPADWVELSLFVTGAIGINVSPLIAEFATNGDMEAWIAICAETICKIIRKERCKVVLIPHVTGPQGSDFTFMSSVIDHVYSAGFTADDVRLLDSSYSAAESKFIIGQLKIFVGARMHATIAALSSGVPTLSLTYSIKSIGVFRDLLGNDEYCIQAKDITADSILAGVDRLIQRETQIREMLLAKQPEWRQRALNAGGVLMNLMNKAL